MGRRRSRGGNPTNRKTSRPFSVKPLLFPGSAIAAACAAVALVFWLAKKPEPDVLPKRDAPVMVKKTEVEEENKKITLEDVRNGFKTPQEYLKQLEKELSKDNPGLLGILYEPTDAEMRELLRENLRETAVDERDLESLLQKEMESFWFSMKSEDNAAFVAPLDSRTVGKKRFIIVRKNTITGMGNRRVQTEGDIRSIIGHELEHVKDYLKGIVVNGVDLFQARNEGRITEKFFRAFTEVRACHEELRKMLKSRERGDTTTFGKHNITTTIFYYFMNIYLVENTEIDDERNLVNKILAPYRSIETTFERNEDRTFRIFVTYTDLRGRTISMSADYNDVWNKFIPFVP